MIDYLKDLNPEQLDVVFNGNGPCLVLAGAGSGKTRVITYRVAYLLEQGVNPENILLVTFTNKAAGEMVNRVASLSNLTNAEVGGKPAVQDEGQISREAASSSRYGGTPRNDKLKVRLPWAGTFHHIANKILRLHASVLGYAPNFSILDSDDSESLLKLSVKEYKIDGSGKFPSARILQNLISFARNAEMAIDEVLDLKYPNFMQYAEQIRAIADDYSRKKKEANAMDFDDLLVNFALLLNHPETREMYSRKFQYVLVDEYQDTNKIQAGIVNRLSETNRNILVVGDDAQSIYSFRAADIQNILNFENKYPDAKIYRLETNYRSSQEILDLANNVIANNNKQYKKVLKTLESTGVRPELHPRMDQNSEAEFVVKNIRELLDEGTPHKEIAVLFRAAYHSQMLEMQLVRAGIAYDYRGGLRFFERAHVKDVLCYLRILNNFSDTSAWLRVLMHEEGIGPAGAQKVIEGIRQLSSREEPQVESKDPLQTDVQGIPPLAMLGRNDNFETMKEIGFNLLGERARAGWSNFIQIWDEMTKNKKMEPADLIRVIAGSNYQNYLESEFTDAEERIKDLEQLAVFAEKYGDLSEFLTEATLQESFSLRGQTSPSYKGGDREGVGTSSKKIILSTIHQAKGLEWHAVFLLNLSSGGFPNDRALREPDGLEEERRLFYVAITRAKRKLMMTYPMASGGAGDFLSGPSLFLSEISEGLLDDRSLLNYNSTVLDDDLEDVHYVPEDGPVVIKPGSFLRDVGDL
ncbi:MAG: ATP-dependent helicase [bacterium]